MHSISQGNLQKGSDPAGGSDTLARADITDGYQVTGTTAEGRISTYEVKNLATGDQQLQDTLPDSTMVTTLIKPDGTRTYNFPDGTQTNIAKGPDPRFFMQAPVTQRSTISTPGGKILTTALSRSVLLADPNNALSITALTDTYSINGRAATLVFNAAGRTYTDTSPAGRQIVKTVDAMSRVTQGTVAGLAPVNYAYDDDDKGRLSRISTGGRTTGFTYNSTSGYPETRVDALGRTTRFFYNTAGRRTQTTLPDGSVVTYAYDAHGNMTSLTPPGSTPHTFSYNGVDLLSDYTAPGGTITSYAYNKDRQPTQITKPGGISVTYSYDAVKGRLNTVTLPTGQIIGFLYNPATGKVSTVTAPDDTTVSFTYDGALLTGEAWSGAIVGSVTRAYDNDFRVSSLTITGGTVVSFQYDSDSLLTNAGAITISRSAQNGLLTGTALGAVNDTFSYNQFGEPASYSASSSGLSLYSVQYTRDNLGRITGKTETTDGPAHTYDYTYDLAGRLSEVKKDNAVTASYTFDSNGNRLTGPGGATGTYDAQDRMLTYGTAAYQYTANGELQSKTDSGSITTFNYDAIGNLLSVTRPNPQPNIEYIVDGLNRRIGKKAGGTLVQGFLYGDKLHPVAELDGTNNVVSTFVYGSRNNVPDYMVKGGVTYRIIADHLGSPRLVVKASDGTIAQRMDYDEFGRVTQDTSPGFQPFGFAGGLYDKDTGLVRFGARDYDAETGRWTAKDPILFAGRTTNLYAYVNNNPVNAIDVVGLGPGFNNNIVDYNEYPNQAPITSWIFWQYTISTLYDFFIGNTINQFVHTLNKPNGIMILLLDGPYGLENHGYINQPVDYDALSPYSMTPEDQIPMPYGYYNEHPEAR